MTHKRLDAGAGWNWIAQGWRLFLQNPGIWVVLALLFGIIYFVLGIIPIIGGLAAALLGPALFGGLVYGARELDDGRSLELAHLFQAFREPGRAGPMLTLGLVPLVGGIISVVLGMLFLAGAAGTGAATGSGAAAAGAAAGGGLLMSIIGIVIGLIVGALLLCAIPRVMTGVAEPFPAIQASARAVLDNIAAYLVFAVIYFVLAIIAAIPLFIGFLVLLPVMAGAVHAANRQLFGEEAEDPVADARTES